MKDEHIIPAGTTPAERAVSYVLQRIRVDANLRWYMLGTQAFALLCAAEAARTGETAESVEDRYSALAEHARPREPDVEKLRRKLEEAERQLAVLEKF